MKKVITIAAICAVCLLFIGFIICGKAPEHTANPARATESTQAQSETEAPPEIPKSKIIDAPYIYQIVDYPNGCESVSAVMALQYFGIDITVDEFIDNYLDMGSAPIMNGLGPDPTLVYCGDPRRKDGWGCHSSVIVNALAKFIDYDSFTVSAYRGRSLDELCRRCIDRDIPVIIWATVGMFDSSGEQYWASWTTPEGKKITYNKRLHCLLLVGYDEDNYYFNDSMNISSRSTRYIGYSKATAEKAYEILGKQSIVISPK